MSRPAAAAGPPPQPDAARIALELRKLGVAGSVLYVAAHPDDENTALLAYLANGALVRTGYLSLTRGDGGQNLIGSEQGPALGLIRTQELLAARRIDGAEQFFTRARDFGFSKNPEETLKIWGREAVLADVVAVIRKFRPDVIVTRFSPGPAETHGHHTASAILAVEAFHAAADPKFHPEQLVNGVEPWQARRIYWNRSSFFIKPTDDVSGDIKLDVGGYNPLLGESYGEMAADSRSMHKSQGFGVARSRAPTLEYFKLLAEAGGAKPLATQKPPASILDGIDVTLKRFAGTARLRSLVDKAIAKFEPAAPASSVATLAAIDAAAGEIPDPTWRAEKRREAQRLMLACAGLFVDATAAEFRAAPGNSVDITVTAVDRSATAVKVDEVRFPFQAAAHAVGKPLATPPADKPGAAAAFELKLKESVQLPADLPPTTPYWLETPPEAGLYHTPDASLVGAPERASPVRVDVVLTVDGRKLTVTREVAYKWTDPVMGERYRPFEVTPAVSVQPDTSALLFSDSGPRPLSVRLVAGAPGVSGVLRPEPPAGWLVEPASAPFSLAAAGAEAVLAFHVRPAAPSKPVAPGVVHVVAEVGAARLSKGVVRIEHPHIPVQTYLVDADVRLTPIALAIAGANIGYVPGPGDEVPAALRRVGYQVTLLGDETLAAGAPALARFDAVVIGVRAFNTSERLRAAHAALMTYVGNGGTLVVQYNTNNRLAPLTAPLGPWPFDIGQKRVTDETAPVTVTQPGNPALTTPNAIGPRDFDGWVQERGLYFADKWDGHYDTPLSMHDPGEAPLAGSLLWAHHGKGTFVYTGLAFFRQLPAGVPGAYRLFANLLAGGHAAGGHGR